MQEQGWVTAINLRKGDTIETMDGFVHITKVERTRHEEAVPVYNFHVKDWTSYFVGKIKCYVHNNDNGRLGHFDSSSVIKNIKSKSPQQLIADGWKDITNPKMAANTTSRGFCDPKPGLKIRFDKGVGGANGFEAVDHYHVMNSNYTNKKVDYYLDIYGKPAEKGSKASHIVIKGEE